LRGTVPIGRAQRTSIRAQLTPPAHRHPAVGRHVDPGGQQPWEVQPVTLGRRLMPAWERDERLEATIDRLLVERGNDPAEFEYREEKEAQASQTV
jgi:hypothetical protein